MMAAKRSTTALDVDMNMQVDDETLEELQQLEQEEICRIVQWGESIVDALADTQDFRAVDLDLYLADGVLFELYGVLCYPDLESDPISEPEEMDTMFDLYQGEGALIAEIAVDTEDDLVLLLTNGSGATLYLNIGAWSLEEWEELPD